MKTLKGKIMVGGGILLLTVFLAVLLPFGKVHAQTHTTELSDYDRISGGDILNVSSYGSISGLRVLCYRGGAYSPEVNALYTANYTMPTLPSGSMWKFYGVQTNSMENYKYLYFREVSDISILEEAYVVNVNGEYYSPDPSSLYTVSFPDGSTKEIPGNGTMVSFSATQLGVRSIEGKTIHLDVPRDASALQPGDKIKKGDLIYSPSNSDIYTLVYYDPTDPTGNGKRTSTTNITGKYHQVKFTSGSKYDKDEWSVTSTTSVNISSKYIYLDEPAPLGPNASSLKAEDLLREGDQLTARVRGGINNPWYFIYRNPDNSADSIREEIITDYTVRNAYDRYEWKVVTIDASARCIYAEATGTPQPSPESVDASVLQPGRALRRGDKLYSPDLNSPWHFIYRNPDGSADFIREEIITDYMVTDAYGKEEWTVVETDASSRCIYAEVTQTSEPQPSPESLDASALQPGRALRRGDKLFSPDPNSPWYFVYRNPDGSADFIRETIVTDYMVTNAYGKEEWTVVETDASARCIYAEVTQTSEPQPSPESLDASTLQPGRALRRGDKLFSPDPNSPWCFIYRNPDNSADSIREEIITDYTVTNAYGREEWTVVETDASDKCIYAEANETPEPEPERGPGPCHHEFEWETQIEPTETTAGLMYNKCTKCGYVAQTLETSGYPVFCENTVKAIRAAEVNAAVKVDTNIWTSFTQPVIDALAARPDVTLNVIYKYEGKYYTTTLPAGADLTGLVNEDGYCGFRYLDQVFGGSEVVR